MLYNKFNVDGSSPPNNPPPHPNTNYSCVVATTDHWKVARCNESHHVICQSDYDTLPGIITRNQDVHLVCIGVGLLGGQHFRFRSRTSGQPISLVDAPLPLCRFSINSSVIENLKSHMVHTVGPIYPKLYSK